MASLTNFSGVFQIKAPSATASLNAAGLVVRDQVSSLNYMSMGPVATGGTTNQNDLIGVTPLYPYNERAIRNAPKTAAEAWTAGQKLYLIVATGIYTTTVGTNQLAGVALADVAAAATVGDVLPCTPF
jgi:hypothetical protein